MITPTEANMRPVKLLLSFIVVFIFSSTILSSQNSTDKWRAGVARQNITPQSSVWLAGYSSRTSPSQGKLHDLWAKAITFEDIHGKRSVLITTDLLTIPKEFSDKFKSKVKQQHGLDQSQIILSCSHTHSGPVVGRALKYIYPMSLEDWEVVDKYTKELEAKLLRLVDESIKSLAPAKIYTKNGIARFQVNRRNNKEAALETTTELKGPNDYAVPVIKVEGANEQLIAVVFGYACHPTTLSINQFSGDYPGFAQIELEQLYPGTTAMFFQGAGADQNPLPRRSIPLAIQYGKQLAATVERVLSEDMIKQDSKLITKYNEIVLPLDAPLPLEELKEITKNDNYHGRWAQGMIDDLDKNGKLIDSYPFPIAYWKLGDQAMFVLGGESVIEYSLKLKEIFGEQSFVMSYANDVMGYIPSETVLDEGGYEADAAQRVYGLPAKWSKGVESLIINGVSDLTQ